MRKLFVASVLGLVLVVGIAPSSTNKRAYVAGRFALDLDGVTAGFLSSTEGGSAYADVVEAPIAGGAVNKHPAGVKYEDITIVCGTGLTDAFYGWLKSTFDHKYARKNGAIIAADYDYKERSRRAFTNAFISEISFPALDGSSKDPAYMTVKLKPESIQHVLKPAGELKPVGKAQKKWLPSNFRLRIDGLDDSLSRVNKIDALTFKVKFTNTEGPRGGIVQVATGLDIPNLVITLPESDSQPFYDWFDSFVIQGKGTDDQEKGGTLEYLAADLKEILFTLTFKNLGIFKVSPDKSEANSDQIKRVKFEMYCEDVQFTYGRGVVQ